VILGRTHAHLGRLPLTATSLILFLTATYLAIGTAAFVAWQATGNVKWVEHFFRVPGAVVTVWLALVQLWLCFRVWNWYSAEEPMYRTWLLIALSALTELAGATLIQFLVSDPMLRRVGHFLGGTVRFTLLAAGMWSALRVYRRAGFLGRLKWWQWLAVAIAAVFVVLEFRSVLVAVRAGKELAIWEILGWPVDPLLAILLTQAFLLRNSIQRMGQGWIGRTWNAASIGVFLVLLGNIGAMAEAYGYLPWPWSSVTWYVWIPASCAFALTPAYQLEAIHRATATGATA
jgi:hypothetical protein